MNSEKKSSSQVDLRGFDYALAPYVLQQQWRMEKLQSQLAKAQAVAMEAQKKLDALTMRLQAQAEHMQKSLLTSINPATYQHGLAFLGQLQEQIVVQKQFLHDLQSNVARLRSANIAQQSRLDGLDEHKLESERAYAAEIIRSTAAEADRDWIARGHHHTQSPSASVEVPQ